MACFLAEANDKTIGTSGGFKSLYEPKPQTKFCILQCFTVQLKLGKRDNLP